MTSHLFSTNHWIGDLEQITLFFSFVICKARSGIMPTCRVVIRVKSFLHAEGIVKCLAPLQVLGKLAINILIRVIFIWGKEVRIGEGNHLLRRPDVKDSYFQYSLIITQFLLRSYKGKKSKIRPIYSYLLSIYYVPGILLGPESLKINKIHFLSSGNVEIGTVNFHH